MIFLYGVENSMIINHDTIINKDKLSDQRLKSLENSSIVNSITTTRRKYVSDR